MADPVVNCVPPHPNAHLTDAEIMDRLKALTPPPTPDAVALVDDFEEAVKCIIENQHGPSYEEARAAVLAAMRPTWFKMETLVHDHVDDKPLSADGRAIPATYTSDPVILTNGKRVWVERSVIMGGARSSSADKFTAYPSGDKPTHWMPLPAAPEAPR